MEHESNDEVVANITADLNVEKALYKNMVRVLHERNEEIAKLYTIIEELMSRR